MGTKRVKEGIKGRPIYLEFIIGDVTVEHQLICPMCGETNFVLSENLELGGCVNEQCPCICFERTRDSSDLGGVRWLV